jgi:glyoxylase-like metal-dependent hydrolase (beta-lactamase superfamily II)
VEGAIGAGVWMEPSCGHTPGHVTIHVSGGGRDGIMSGDMIHHPILFTEPNLINVGDFDPPMAAESRQRLIERCADTDTYLLTMHFPSPTAGHIRSTQNGFKFFFAE